jgi:hypothetical protein
MKKLFVLFALLSATLLTTGGLRAQVSVQITIAPPPIPVYVQPECPIEGYLWTPGYWDYDGGYYWVPGVWIAPEQPGFLWTPGYWDYDGGYYGWHHGYWGEHVGYYGGISYGYGYWGSGFYGGEWSGGVYRYNTAVSHVNTAVVHNTYTNSAVVNHDASPVSFHGPGGATAQPTPQERAAMSERHAEASPVQRSHEQAAKSDKNQFATVNHGKPAVAAMTAPNGQRVNTEGHAVNNSPAAKPAESKPTPVQRNPNEGHPQAPNRTAPENHAAPAPHNAVQPRPQTTPAQRNPNEGRPQQQPNRQPAPQQQSRPQSQPTPQQRNPNEGRPQQQPNRQPAPQQQSRPQSQPMPQQRPQQSAPQQQPRQQSQPMPQQQHNNAPEPQHNEHGPR